MSSAAASRAFVLGLALLALPAHAVETLRIAMDEVRGRVEVSALRLAMGPDVEDAQFHDVPGGSVVVRRVGERVEVNGALVVGGAVRFRSLPASADDQDGSRTLRAGARVVRGDVVVRRWKHGLLLINVIALEDYLAAMLGSEMPVSFPREALKAQAVAARTYALHKKLAAYGEPFHLGSSVLHQVYRGANREDPRTREAVGATRGEVLTWELAPIEAYFHASCGGRTESGREALGRDLPYLASVECRCGRRQGSRWSLSLSAEELQRAVGGDPTSLRVLSRSDTGRARVLALSAERTLDAVTFRQRLGYARVRSLDFELEPTHGSEAVRIAGRGFGHGAGLCQWGARAAAGEGWDYRRILAHYYPGAELQHLY